MRVGTRLRDGDEDGMEWRWKKGTNKTLQKKQKDRERMTCS